MNRHWATAAAVGALCIGALAVFRVHSRRTAPESVVQRMFDAARRGDARQYLTCFTGALRRRLDSVASEAGRRQFSRDLRARYARVMGVAITRLTSNTPDSSPARRTGIALRVETLYRARNEVQEYRVQHLLTGWRIVRIGPARSVTMPIKYGTPVIPPSDSRTVLPDRSPGEPRGTVRGGLEPGDSKKEGGA